MLITIKKMTKARKLIKKLPSICKKYNEKLIIIMFIGQSIELDVINVKKTFVRVVKNTLIILVKHASNLKSLKIPESVDFVGIKSIQMPHFRVENQHLRMFVINKNALS